MNDGFDSGSSDSGSESGASSEAGREPELLPLIVGALLGASIYGGKNAPRTENVTYRQKSARGAHAPSIRTSAVMCPAPDNQMSFSEVIRTRTEPEPSDIDKRQDMELRRQEQMNFRQEVALARLAMLAWAGFAAGALSLIVQFLR